MGYDMYNQNFNEKDGEARRDPDSGYSFDSYHESNAQPSGSNGSPAPEPKKKKGAAKILAICLAVVVLVGGVGVGVGALIDSGFGIVPAETTDGNESLADTVLPTPVSQQTAQQLQAAYTGQALSAPEIYALVSQSTVGVTTPVTTTNIFGQVSNAAISGSGFIISEDGYILTNYHVVEDADEQGLEILVMLYSGEEYSARIIGKDADNDVALLKIDATGLTPVKIGSSESLVVGEQIYAIGNPLGELTYTFTDGIVSALDRTIRVDANTEINMFQISAAINSGNSGGPVINERGEVVGFASAKYAESGVEGLGFAIPIDDAMDIVNDLLEYGYVRGKPYFGITVNTANAAFAQYYNTVEGAYVTLVDEDSCAADAGLRVGDIITAIDETEIRSFSDLVSAKNDYTAGDTVELTVYRGGEYLTLTLTFDEAGANAASGSVAG